MVLYGLALVPLATTLHQAHPEVVQAWYADDGQLQGHSSRVAVAMIDLQRLGPERGYFPEPAKSIFVCNPEDRPGAEERLEAFGFKFVDGSRPGLRGGVRTGRGSHSLGLPAGPAAGD
jgi:hypothetical protein